MTEEQLDALVTRCEAGEGVEAVVASMELNSEQEMQFLKDHPRARALLRDAKAAAAPRAAAAKRLG